MSVIPSHVQAFIDSIKDVNFYSCSGPIDPSWKLFIGNTWDAVYDAARGAVYDATRGAVYDATRGAVFDAALDAVYSAARDAARDAARSAAYGAVYSAALDAVYDAARGAARGAAFEAAHDAGLLAVCLLAQDKIDKKHVEYAKARWEVWKRGYGCYCDVDGVLCVYAKLNGLEKARRRI